MNKVFANQKSVAKFWVHVIRPRRRRRVVPLILDYDAWRKIVQNIDQALKSETVSLDRAL